MNRLGLLISLVLPTVAISCTNHTAGNSLPVPYVQRMISDTTSAGYALVSSYNPKDPSGTIAVVGMPEDVVMVTEVLLSTDTHNNVSGSAESDGLPDFSGETVAMMLDAANSPYSAAGGENSALQLREVNVRNFMAAIDTVCYSSPYDIGNPIAKPASKLVVLASSLSSFYGLYDIDTLCKFAKSSIPVVSRQGSMINYAFRKKKSSNMVMWSSVQNTDTSTAYSSFVPPRAGNADVRLISLVGEYLKSGGSKEISTILLDDMSVSADSVRTALCRLVLTDSDSLIQYRKVVSKNTAVIGAEEAIAEECYEHLRRTNGFTHKISYPSMKPYISTIDEDNISYIYVELRDKYMTPSLMEFMSTYAPKTFSLYVR